jgi:hypothetical protein
VIRVRQRIRDKTPSVAVLFSAEAALRSNRWGSIRRGGELSVEAARLPGGERCPFRAIAGAELQSATADTESFELMLATRRLYLVTPSDECGIAPGSVGAQRAYRYPWAWRGSSARDSLEFESPGRDRRWL